MRLNDFGLANVTLEGYHVNSYLEQASANTEEGINQLLTTIDGAVERQESQIGRLENAYENLSGSVFGALKSAISSVSSVNLASLRAKIMAAAGSAVSGLLPLLFDKALDTAFSYASRYAEGMADRIMRSLSVYAEMFFRSDRLITEACAAYLSKQIVSDLRDIANEMGSIEQVMVRMNALAKDLDAVSDALFGIPDGGPGVFLDALVHVRRARARIGEGLLELENTGVLPLYYLTSARHAVRAAQEVLPHAPLTEFDLARLESLLTKLGELQDLIASFTLRIDVIVKRYLRIVAYAAMIRSLPESLFQESRLLKSLTSEIGLKSVDGQLETIEGRLDRYSDTNMTPQEVYHRSTIERMALEAPYLELLMMERLFYDSQGNTSQFQALLDVLDDPFFKGDPFAEFKRMVRRYTGIINKSASVTDRTVTYSSNILYTYRGIRTDVIRLAAEVEFAAPHGQGVDTVTDAITGIMQWAGIRNPMMVVSSGMVVATLLTKQVSNLKATARLARTTAQNVSVYDVSSGVTDYVESSVGALASRAQAVGTDLIMEPLANFRPFYRTASDAMERARLTTEGICTVRTEALIATDISQVIMDSAPQFDDGRARGLNRMKSVSHE